MSSDASNTWEPPSPEELQAMLPQYEITGIIGRGGMGAVYRAKQAKLDRDVAIKLLPESLTQEGEDDTFKYAARFELEAKAMAGLDHPGIVHVYDFGETEKGQLYFVMEFIDGMDIHQYIRENGGILSQEYALSITAHVLDALEYAHSHGIVHRDIKPANILLNHEGRVKIADFGLAKTFTDSVDDSAPALTMTNMALGTPDFVAPEALDCDGKPDHRADLYAVGVMLYRMLTGALPRGQFKLPSEMNQQLDPRLDEIISHSLQTDPDDRYSSAGELHQALQPVITSPLTRMEMNAEAEAASAPVVEVKEAAKPKSKTGVYVGITVVSLVVIGGLSTFFLNQSDSEKSGVAIQAMDSKEKVPVKSTLVDSSESPAKANSAEAESTEKPPPVAKVKEQSTGKSPVPQKSSPTKIVKSTSVEVPQVTQSAAGKSKTPPKTSPEPPADSPEPNESSETKKAHPAPAKIAASPPANTDKGSEKATPTGSAAAKPVPAPKPTLDITAIPGLKTRLDGYLDARRDQVGTLASGYLRGLDARLNQAADGGNLTLVKAFRDEKARVEALQKKLTTPPKDLLAAVAESATLTDLPETTAQGVTALRATWETERRKIRDDLDGKLRQSLLILGSQLTKARDFVKAEKVLTYRESLENDATETAPLAADTPESVKSSIPNSAVATSSLKLPQWLEKAAEKGGKLRIWGTIKGTPINEAEVLKEMRENDYVRVMTYENGLIFGMRRNGNGYHIVTGGQNPILKQVESRKVQALDPAGGSWLADNFAWVGGRKTGSKLRLKDDPVILQGGTGVMLIRSAQHQWISSGYNWDNVNDPTIQPTIEAIREQLEEDEASVVAANYGAIRWITKDNRFREFIIKLRPGSAEEKTVTTQPEEPIVELFNNGNGWVARGISGSVYTDAHGGFAAPIPELSPALAIRKSNSAFAVRATDGTWRMSTHDQTFKEFIPTVGPALDLDFHNNAAAGTRIVLWIEPDTALKPPEPPAPVATAPTAKPAGGSSDLKLPQWLEKAAEKGGKLRIWGTWDGKPIEERKALKELRESDYTQVMTGAHDGVILGVRERGNGKCFVMEDANPAIGSNRLREFNAIHGLERTNGFWESEDRIFRDTRRDGPERDLGDDSLFASTHSGGRLVRDRSGEWSATGLHFTNPEDPTIIPLMKSICERLKADQPTLISMNENFTLAWMARDGQLKALKIALRPGRVTEIAVSTQPKEPLVQLFASPGSIYGNWLALGKSGAVYAEKMGGFEKPVAELSPALALRLKRAGRPHVLAARKPDGTWHAIGTEEKLIAHLAKVGPALDLDVYIMDDQNYFVVWIESNSALKPR